MGNRLYVTTASAAFVAAVGWWATAAGDDKGAEARRLVVYRMKNNDARTVAESLNRLLGERQDVRILADTKANALLVFADEKDQATLRAFLALVDRTGPRGRIESEPPPKMMFPEEVERAMMGEALRLQRMWGPVPKAEPGRMWPAPSKPEFKWDEFRWDVPKPSKP